MSTTRVENSGRTDPHKIEPFEHPAFDLSMQKIRISRSRCTPVKLTSYGIEAQTSDGSHPTSISTTTPRIPAYARSDAG
jgi:hypothetical protein